MQTIYKYPISVGYGCVVSLDLPEESEPLFVGVQNNMVYMWVKITLSTDAPIQRQFKVVATGEQFDDTNLEYINTVFVNELVYHVFEVFDHAIHWR